MAITTLFSSTVQALHMVQTIVNSVPTWTWVPYGDSRDSIKCRLDMTFIRPGKDQLPAVEAGRASDRVGVMFCDSNAGIRAGDRIVATAGPVTGTFEIRNIPDFALDLTSAHHIEVQIVETAQQLAGEFPGATS